MSRVCRGVSLWCYAFFQSQAPDLSLVSSAEISSRCTLEKVRVVGSPPCLLLLLLPLPMQFRGCAPLNVRLDKERAAVSYVRFLGLVRV